jgi:stage II sporulation protein E
MKCDSEAAERIEAALAAAGFPCGECICLINSSGRVNVELEFPENEERVPKGLLMREVSKCCGKRFDLPVLSRAGNRIRAALCEMPLYDVEIGSDQHIANSGKLCGDCIDYFNDGFGTTYSIICDGMGTGGRAAVDGNMATSVMGRLLRSGLTPSSALQIVNTALMIKSDDESLSTIDIAGVDLYSGKVKLQKAGAPLTFIKKGGRIIKKEMPSLPAGILNGIKFKTDSVKLNTGDMVVMVSDGVITGDEKWLEKLIKSWNEGSTQELARAVVEEAVRRRASARDDDVTAVAMRITGYSD